MGVALIDAFLVLASATVRQTHAQGNKPRDFVSPVIFQSAGSRFESIKGSVDDYRFMLGITVNGNAAGPLSNGHREINWDGERTDIAATTLSPNPFDGFKVAGGALFTTPDGTGFVQAPHQPMSRQVD